MSVNSEFDNLKPQCNFISEAFEFVRRLLEMVVAAIHIAIIAIQDVVKTSSTLEAFALIFDSVTTKKELGKNDFAHCFSEVMKDVMSVVRILDSQTHPPGVRTSPS